MSDATEMTNDAQRRGRGRPPLEPPPGYTIVTAWTRMVDEHGQVHRVIGYYPAWVGPDPAAPPQFFRRDPRTPNKARRGSRWRFFTRRHEAARWLLEQVAGSSNDSPSAP